MKNMNIEEMRAAIKDLDTRKNELTKALKEKEAEEEAAHKQKLADEKEARKAHVISLMEETEKALKEYIKDYGSFRHRTEDDDFFPGYLFHNFLF